MRQLKQLKPLDRDVARLIVEAAMAAPNYMLLEETKVLLAAFPVLHLDRKTRAISRAFVYLGLHRPRTALKALDALDKDSAEAKTLRTAITFYLEQAEHKKRSLN